MLYALFFVCFAAVGVLTECGLIPDVFLPFLGAGRGRRALSRLAARELQQHRGHQEHPLVPAGVWLVSACSWTLAPVTTGVGATRVGSSVEVSDSTSDPDSDSLVPWGSSWCSAPLVSFGRGPIGKLRLFSVSLYCSLHILPEVLLILDMWYTMLAVPSCTAVEILLIHVAWKMDVSFLMSLGSTNALWWLLMRPANAIMVRPAAPAGASKTSGSQRMYVAKLVSPSAVHLFLCVLYEFIFVFSPAVAANSGSWAC